MKKKILTLVAVCAAMTANATVLRVSNVNGSTAPYSTIQSAVDAATAGDTIMVDGSTESYGETEIDKQLVLIGPGYWINDNELVQEAVPSAKVQFIVNKGAAGTIIKGFSTSDRLNAAFEIHADKCVVTRCYIKSSSYLGILFTREDSNDPMPSGAVVHQNFFDGCNVGGSSTNVQITNNIFCKRGQGEWDISGMESSYIAYNTMINGENIEISYAPFNMVNTSTIEYNILWSKEIRYDNIGIKDKNHWGDNLVTNVYPSSFNTDKDVQAAELAVSEGKYGAFAGDSPYVLSGIPAAPVIEDLIVPTTVEAGSKMKVTLKVGIQK